jgi:hypothetical protein
MPKVVITHGVPDVDRWLKYKAERVQFLGPFATDITDHVAMDGSRNVSVSLNVRDLAAFQATLASPPPELAAAMERHGVQQPLAVFVEK